MNSVPQLLLHHTNLQHYDLKISFCYAAPITQNLITNIAIQMDGHLKCFDSSSDIICSIKFILMCPNLSEM